MINSAGRWDLQVDASVIKTLETFPRHDVERIDKIIGLLGNDPFFGDIKKMKGEGNIWRRRIGAYRLFYKLDVSVKTIFVFHVERRTSSTY